MERLTTYTWIISVFEVILPMIIHIALYNFIGRKKEKAVCRTLKSLDKRLADLEGQGK
jgi:uncharacterized membrane protein (DUF106 family)